MKLAESIFYKVRAGDGNSYMTSSPGGLWELVFFRRERVDR